MYSIRVLAWNANGLEQRKDELQCFLNLNKIDICLIAETHFTKQKHIYFKGYKIYQSVHPANNGRGGSAIIIKESIAHHEDIPIVCDEYQVALINIMYGGSPLKIGAIYSPPRSSLKNHDYQILLKTLGKRFIVGGDFNAKHTAWGSRLVTTKGRELNQAATELSCSFLSTGDFNKLTW